MIVIVQITPYCPSDVSQVNGTNTSGSVSSMIAAVLLLFYNNISHIRLRLHVDQLEQYTYLRQRAK